MLGTAFLQSNAGVTTTAYGVSGQVRVENAGGTITSASGVRAVVGLNAGVMTNAYGVLVDNVAIAGSGTGKYGLYVKAQTVATPGNWSRVANIYSEGNVPNILSFEGVIASTRATGQPPRSGDLFEHVRPEFLNVNYIEGHRGARRPLRQLDLDAAGAADQRQPLLTSRRRRKSAAPPSPFRQTL